MIRFLLSNSPFWYVDAGMNYVVGPGWRDQWDVVIASAGKPAFYTEDARPFREVDPITGKPMFKQVRMNETVLLYVRVMSSELCCNLLSLKPQLSKVLKLEKGHVYTAGCLKELTKCLDWSRPLTTAQGDFRYDDISSPLASPNVMYIGDSLFADLVDAKREVSVLFMLCLEPFPFSVSLAYQNFALLFYDENCSMGFSSDGRPQQSRPKWDTRSSFNEKQNL